MNALVLHAVGDARYEQVPMPVPGPGQVRVQVAVCGVCNSDLSRFFGGGPYSFPLVCGHEFAGTVEQNGPGVEHYGPGDRVAVFPLLWCGACGPCERSRYAQCTNYDYLGSRSDGAFAEFVVAPTRNLIRLPPAVSLEEAAMIEPAAVALHALRRARGDMIGECVAVFGAGPIGLLAAQWARAMGAAPVAIFDIVSEKLQLAVRLGFPHAYDAAEANPIRVIGELTGGLGARLCIEAAGTPQAALHALKAAARDAKIVLLGNPTADLVLPTALVSQLLRREVAVLGTWNSDYSAAGDNDDWHLAVAGMSAGTVDVKPLMSHRIKLSRAFDALRMMNDRKEFYCKVLIFPERGA